MIKKYKLKRTTETGIQKPIIDEARFSINYKNELNDSQYQAVTAIEGTYLLIAGAGTGKTRTLVYRVARLIETGYDPKSILLLTFTRKAAREMMHRAASLLDSRCTRINGGTFHSFANITLRRYAKAIGLNPNFTILDQSDSEDVINLIRGTMDVIKLKKRFPTKQTILKVLSLNVNTSATIEDILYENYPHFIEHLDKITEIGKKYKEYKKANSLLDYDDLLVYLLKFLAQQSDAAKGLLSSIKFIMVDEYQDTNKLQADIVKRLASVNNNVMVVGDDSQSIYSFRGANFKNIMEFPNYFDNVKIIKLEENYRSTQRILNFANRLLDFAAEKFPKKLYTNIPGGKLPAIITTPTDNHQSRFIVERILELREEELPLSEIAVLFRSSYHSFDLEIELNRANIPYVKFGGMKFVETAHIKDVLAFLRITQNSKDFVSWNRILLLHEGIGPKRAQMIIKEIYNNNLLAKDLLDEIKADKLLGKVFDLLKLIQNIKENYQLPSDKIAVIYTYYNSLFKKKYDDYNKRKKDLDALINIANNYDSTTNLLTDMVLEPPQNSVVDVEEEEKEDEFLTLSTIHSAKGLEWHSVFIINAVDGFFPSTRAFDSPASLEEERRLMYVAVTRAKQNLHISYPINIFDRYSGYTLSKPSRFIENIDEELVEQWEVEE